MKCEVCLELLEEYIDGELAERESSEVAAHLITCASCASNSAALAAELEMFSHYDRDLEVPKTLWGKIAEQTVTPVVAPVSNSGFASWFAGLFRVPALGFSVATAFALILVAILIGSAYWQTRKIDDSKTAQGTGTAPKAVPAEIKNDRVDLPKVDNATIAVNQKHKSPRPAQVKHSGVDQSDLVSSDIDYQDMEDHDTAVHIEQTQNLLRSIRNVSVNDGEQDIDVTYDKALSRRLLNENIVLRRDAEMKGKVPAKALLSDLEPFLIDIANLPDQARPDEVRAIKERVQKTEIVAALIGY